MFIAQLTCQNITFVRLSLRLMAGAGEGQEQGKFWEFQNNDPSAKSCKQLNGFVFSNILLLLPKHCM